MRIRRARINDKKGFIGIQKEAFPNLDSQNQGEYFYEKIKEKEIFILEEKGEYAGHICFGSYKLTPPFAGGVFVEELAVKKKQRKQGIGTALMDYLINYCKKNKFSMLYLSTGDFKGNKAINYYKKLGFIRMGTLKEIDPHSEYNFGQLIMGKILK